MKNGPMYFHEILPEIILNSFIPMYVFISIPAILFFIWTNINLIKTKKQLSIIDNLVDRLESIAMLILTPEGKVIRSNANLGKILGHEKEIFNSKEFTYYKINQESEVAQTLNEIVSDMISNKQAYYEEEIYVKTPEDKSKYKFFRLIISAQFHKNKIDFLMCIFKDISSDIALDEERQKSYYHSKMSSIGVMAGGLAHEINTPLCSALLCIEALERSDCNKKSKESIFYLNHTKKSIEKISQITQALKKHAYHNSIANEKSEVEIIEFLGEVITICNLDLRAHEINVELISSYKSIHCRINPDVLSHILINLLTNARDAINDLKDKWIKIHADLDETTEGYILQIRVTDSGLGIPTEIQEKMMLPSFTTKKYGQGSSLGMGIIQENLIKINGVMTYEKYKEHTSFLIKVPINLLQEKENTYGNGQVAS